MILPFWAWFPGLLKRRVGVPVNTVAPIVSGSTTEGTTLTTTNGSWTNSPTAFAYQ
jgi:hypothetical protein